MRLNLLLLLSALSFSATAWEGYDYNSGSYVEIGKGNLVRRGKDIEIYDTRDNSYKTVEVQSIRGRGRGAEVETYNYSTGEYRTFDMD